MDSLTNLAGRELLWTPSRTGKRAYALGMDGRTVATLVQPSLWRQDSVAVTATGRWRFARVGFLRQRYVIADADTGVEVAQMSRSDWTRSGTLRLPDGRQYLWRSGGFWGSKWVWLDTAARPLLRFRQFGALRAQCAVTVEPETASEPHLALLATLGWYLMLLMREDTTAATVAVIAATH